MAKNSVRDFSSTAASNTDIQSIDIDENCAASGINNAIREVMADLKDVSVGTVALETPQADGLTIGTSNLDMNGNEVILDADADTSITADTDDQIDFKVGGADQIALTDGVLAPSTDDDVDLGSTTKRFNDLFLGGGLYVGGTGSANQFDDYEEGTWTGSVSVGGGTVSIAEEAYTKIGNIVHVMFTVNFSSASGTFSVLGLPFTATTWAVGIGREDASNGYAVYGRVSQSASQVDIYYAGATANATPFQVASGNMRFSLTYQTS